MAKVRKKKRQPRGGGDAAEVPRLSVGERLRQAREARGLELVVVAERLHLKQSMVVALENEDFDRLPARVFVRGYYRNYARLLELPEEPLLREFDARCPEGEECAGAPPVVAQGVRKEIRSSHGLVRLVTWLVVVSVVAALALWWKDRAEREAVALKERPSPVSLVTAAGEGPPAPEASTASAGGEVAGAPAEREERGAEPAPEAPPRPPVEPSDTPAPLQAVQTEAETAPVPESPPPSVPAEVVLRFVEDSWVDVRGAGGSFKLVGLRKAGEEIRLEGSPPYNMILGNARGVQLLVDGKPYDLSSKTRRNVARLTLNP